MGGEPENLVFYQIFFIFIFFSNNICKPLVILFVIKLYVHSSVFKHDIYSKYLLVIPLKDKKGSRITDGFQKVLDESNCKPEKI